jgi:hypothetical protein
MLTGYHTVEDRGNPDVIEVDGPFKCTRKNAWLGPGYYFWDSKIEWAHKWGKDAYKEKGYVICSAQIENKTEVMFDLFGNVQHQDEFIQVFEALSAKLNTGEKPPLVAEIIHFLVNQNLFPYKSVRAHDEWNQAKVISFYQERAKMRIGQRVQICLFEKNSVTLQDFLIVHPSHYCQTLQP